MTSFLNDTLLNQLFSRCSDFLFLHTHTNHKRPFVVVKQEVSLGNKQLYFEGTLTDNVTRNLHESNLRNWFDRK